MDVLTVWLVSFVRVLCIILFFNCHIVFALFCPCVLMRDQTETFVYVKSTGHTSDGLACITLDMIPADTTAECILDYISETGRVMHESQKVSVLHRGCSVYSHWHLLMHCTI